MRRSCHPQLPRTNMSFCFVIVATTCYVLFLLGCKLASQHVDPKSDPAIHIGDIFSLKMNRHKNFINNKGGPLVYRKNLQWACDLPIVYIDNAKTPTIPTSCTCPPRWLPLMTTTMPVLHGIWCRHPPNFWRPCSLDKVVCVHVAMKVKCVFVLFYPNWHINGKCMYIRNPLEEWMGHHHCKSSSEQSNLLGHCLSWILWSRHWGHYSPT